jgi:hypothetical protein
LREGYPKRAVHAAGQRVEAVKATGPFGIEQRRACLGRGPAGAAGQGWLMRCGRPHAVRRPRLAMI